jgi:hypothetical protein
VKRATVVSFFSMVANLGGVGGQAGLGYLAKVRDYATGYIAGGAFTVLAIPLYFGVRSLKEDAAKIIGKAEQVARRKGSLDPRRQRQNPRLGRDGKRHSQQGLVREGRNQPWRITSPNAWLSFSFSR